MSDITDHLNGTSPVAQLYSVDKITASGITSHIEADSEQRKEIARTLDLSELDLFRFDYELHRTSKGRFKLKGRLTAKAMQNCVVTLEPVPAVIEEAIEIDLWPVEDVERLEVKAEDESMSVQLEGPEPISGDSIDVGQLAYEHFAAALDLYPKKTDAELDWQDPDAGDVRDKPFAALAKLKEMSGSKSN